MISQEETTGLDMQQNSQEESTESAAASQNGPNIKTNDFVLKFQIMFACTTIEIHHEIEIRAVSL